MNKENIRRRIRNVTAFAAALLLAATFTFPAELGDGFFDGFGNAIVASAAWSDSFGKDLTYTFDNGTLTISGTGEIPNFGDPTIFPWYGYSNEIKSVVIENGVTSIGGGAFSHCTILTSVTIPDSVNLMGYNVFPNSKSLESIFLPNTLDDYNVSIAGIPDTATQIKYTVSGNNVTVTSVTRGRGKDSVTIPDTIGGKPVTVAFTDVTSNTSVPSSATQIKYYVIDDKVTINRVTIGSGQTSVTILETIDGNTVTSIGSSAFSNCSSLTSITIPSSVNSIWDYAFYGCSSLTSITIPSSVNSIEHDAFFKCSSLTSIFLPERLTSIGTDAIPASATQIRYTVDNENVTITSGTLGRGQTSVTIPDTIDGKAVTSIGESAFESRTDLASITIPDSVTSIGYGAFQYCTSLESVFLPNTLYVSGGDIPDTATKVRYTVTGDNVTVTGVTLGSGRTSVTIPDTIGGKKVAAVCIKDGATGIDVPASATQIKYTFDNENVIATVAALGKGQASVTIPETIDGKNVTAVCIKDGIKGVVAPASATQIKYTVTDDKVTINKVTIGRGQTSVTIPETIDGKTVTSIGDGAFSGCSSIFLPNTLYVSGADITETATQVKYTVDTDGNVTITSVTLGSGQTSVTIPETICGKPVTVVYIRDGATGIDVPASATQIKYTVDNENVIATVTALGKGQASVTIPETIDGKNVTAVCIKDGITGVVAPASATQIRYTVDNENVTIKGATPAEGVTSVTIPKTIDGKTVTSIGDYAFYNCSSLESITIPYSVTSIGKYAFENCTSLTSITIPDGVTSIGKYAFYYCTSLKSITIPDGVTYIGEAAFWGCSSLTSITIPDGVTSIGEDTFFGCTSLTSIAIPDSVISIGSYAFYICENLTSITIPGSVNSIGVRAFFGCTRLTSITIPVSVNSIGGAAFYGCTSLKSIFLPNTVDVSNAYIPGTATQIRYTVDNEGNITITSVTLGEGQTSLTIPETIDGKAVTNIADGALASCPNVTHEHREKKAATCTEKAVCAICETGYGETEAHSLNKHDAVPASCTTDGKREYYECSVCDKLFTGESGTTEVTLEEITIAAHHSFGEDWESDKDNHWHICTVCGEKSQAEAHTKDEGTVTKEATLTENGTITYKCTVCGADMGEETITAEITSIEVTESNVVVHYTVTGSTEVNSQTLKFSEVTEEMVELMKSKDIKLVIDFVNYSTAGSDTIILTAAQMKAIEYVLEHDFGM